MVNLPGNALGGGPGFWFRNAKFPVLVLPHVCASIRTGKDDVGHELAVCSHRHLIDALGPFPICCLFCVSSQSKHFLVLHNYHNLQEETNICNSCAAGDKGSML